MNSYLVAKISRFRVANLANSLTITCASRLESENFDSQSTSLMSYLKVSGEPKF